MNPDYGGSRPPDIGENVHLTQQYLQAMEVVNNPDMESTQNCNIQSAEEDNRNTLGQKRRNNNVDSNSPLSKRTPEILGTSTSNNSEQLQNPSQPQPGITTMRIPYELNKNNRKLTMILVHSLF